MDKCRVRIEAKPGKLLLGGVRTYTSGSWPRAEAQAILEAMMDQPNAGKGELIKVAPGKKRRRR